MISALCWLPRGAAKALEETADPPPQVPEPVEAAGMLEILRSSVAIITIAYKVDFAQLPAESLSVTHRGRA